jgi:hypothetical protein
VKLAGVSDVTVVWASAPPVETANAANSARKRWAAKRCDDIMTCLNAYSEKGADTGLSTRIRAVFSSESGRNEGGRAKATASYTARLPVNVTKPADGTSYSPYLPAAGLYSLFSDSFGPVP